MIVRLAEAGAPTLVDAADCTKFHVEAPGGDARAAGARLGEAGTADGAPEGHVWVDVAWVRRQAEGQVPGGWAADFDGMLAYATERGWLDADGRAIQAHVVAP